MIEELDLGLFELIKSEEKAKTILHPIRVLGIDLGTTNSVVAEIRWDPKTPKDFKSVCIEIDQETTGGVYTNFLVPSVIAFPNNDKMVGEGAKRLYGRMVEFGFSKEKNIFFECKNEMGCRKTYHSAPEGYRSPAEISGKILEFLKNGVPHDKDYPTKKTLITVPASFQVAQRTDTLKAAELAGISILEGELIDEPIAAFIDFLLSENLKKELEPSNKLLVFDFGGGTCDVAVYRIDTNISSKCLDVSPLIVSRYHRLGGGDIDRAIIHQVLLPQLLEQNNLKPSDLDYEDKKKFIEPALTAVAQALKIGLCNEISHLESFGKYESKNKREVTNQQPGMHKCKLKDRCLELQSPSLTAEKFEKLLEPFLDKDFLYARETEYSLTNSIFSPIEDALERGGITPNEIDCCLMVGGSSLIPQVQKAMEKYFPNADLLKYKDIDAPQLAIAKGASYHALALEVLGTGIFQTVAQDTILIKTESGPIDLIQRGEPLPPQSEGKWREVKSLKNTLRLKALKFYHSPLSNPKD